MSTQPHYYCVVDPKGIPYHPLISLSKKAAIKQWLDQWNAISSLHHAAGRTNKIHKISWKQFQAEGYKCLPVKLEVIKS